MDKSGCDEELPNTFCVDINHDFDVGEELEVNTEVMYDLPQEQERVRFTSNSSSVALWITRNFTPSSYEEPSRVQTRSASNSDIRRGERFRAIRRGDRSRRGEQCRDITRRESGLIITRNEYGRFVTYTQQRSVIPNEPRRGVRADGRRRSATIRTNHETRRENPLPIIKSRTFERDTSSLRVHVLNMLMRKKVESYVV